MDGGYIWTVVFLNQGAEYFRGILPASSQLKYWRCMGSYPATECYKIINNKTLKQVRNSGQGGPEGDFFSPGDSRAPPASCLSPIIS